MKSYKPQGPKRRTLRKDGWTRFNRGESARKRGYDTDWDKLRNAYVAANPLCEVCLRKTPTRVTAAEQVDHKVPFQGIADPLRLDWDNLQSVCVPCHRAEERRRNKHR